MWLTSNMPTAVRTATCSALMPSYWTGISQPAKSTSFAPAATWLSYSGVRLIEARGYRPRRGSAVLRDLRRVDVHQEVTQQLVLVVLVGRLDVVEMSFELFGGDLGHCASLQRAGEVVPEIIDRWRPYVHPPFWGYSPPPCGGCGRRSSAGRAG